MILINKFLFKNSLFPLVGTCCGTTEAIQTLDFAATVEIHNDKEETK
jgi:hypothetical protein